EACVLLRPGSIAEGTLLALILLGMLFLLISPASSDETILHDGFEDGIQEWKVATGVAISQVSSPVNGGSHAAAVSVSSPGWRWAYRVVSVVPGSAYTLQGYVFKNDSGIESAELRAYWYSSSDGTGSSLIDNSSLTSITTDEANWRLLTTAAVAAPASAHSARVGLWVVTSESFSGSATVYLDDVSFTSPAPTPTATPTSTATAIPSPTPTAAPVAASPSPTSSSTPSPTPTAFVPTATPTCTMTHTATAAPPPGAPPPASSPSLTPTAFVPTATVVPTATPTATMTHAATAAPPPGGPPPAPTPTPTSTPVGELLQNGGLETGSGATPLGWSTYGGVLTRVVAPCRRGGYSGAFSSDSAASKWAYQTVSVSPGATYALKGYLYNTDSTATSASLRLSWYPNPDGTGAEIISVDSAGANEAQWMLLAVSGKAPDSAASVRCKVILEPSTDAAVTVYFDDLSFVKIADAPSPPPAGPPLPADTPTATLTPAPAAPSIPTPLPHSIINDSFERATEGIPDGWETFGGNLMQVSHPVRSGSCAAAFTSITASTKWIFQTVAVQPGEWYSFSGFAYKNDFNVTSVYLRLSWYASRDGSGRQLSYDDSLTVLTNNETRYLLLTTGPVLAPGDARSARTRIMLDPLSDKYAIAFFDDIAFTDAEAPPTPTTTVTPTCTASPTATATASPIPTHTSTASPTPQPSSTPVINVTPTPTATMPVIQPQPTEIVATPVSGGVIPGPGDGGPPGQNGREAGDASNSPRRPSHLPQAGDRLGPHVLLIGVTCLALGLFVGLRYRERKQRVDDQRPRTQG
ncbi:MAG: hypothetical protein ABIH46_07330, partial [Chloroflexota bacterium]